MAKKVDLEDNYRSYTACLSVAQQAEQNCDYARMLEKAEASLPLLSEAIAYLRRYQDVEAPRLISIGLILHYSPPMFALKSLDAVHEWYSTASRTDRKAYADLPEQLQAARRELALAGRLWPSWEAAAPIATTGTDSQAVERIVNFWATYGAVVRQGNNAPAEYQLVTHPLRAARGKCARCGNTMLTKWMELLERRVCPYCRSTSEFVIADRC